MSVSSQCRPCFIAGYISRAKARSPVQSTTVPTAMMNWAVSWVLPGLTTPPLVVTSWMIRPLPLAFSE